MASSREHQYQTLLMTIVCAAEREPELLPRWIVVRAQRSKCPGGNTHHYYRACCNLGPSSTTGMHILRASAKMMNLRTSSDPTMYLAAAPSPEPPLTNSCVSGAITAADSAADTWRGAASTSPATTDAVEERTCERVMMREKEDAPHFSLLVTSTPAALLLRQPCVATLLRAAVGPLPPLSCRCGMRSRDSGEGPIVVVVEVRVVEPLALYSDDDVVAVPPAAGCFRLLLLACLMSLLPLRCCGSGTRGRKARTGYHGVTRNKVTRSW